MADRAGWIARWVFIASVSLFGVSASAQESGSAQIGDLTIEDAYARAAGAQARSGAAYMSINNTGTAPDRLISVEGDAAQRIELHNTVVSSDGVASMVRMDDGVPLPPGEAVLFERGGLHVMFMGLNGPFEAGASVPAQGSSPALCPSHSWGRSRRRPGHVPSS